MSDGRVHAFDRLRVLATIGVVLLHGGAGIVGPRLGTDTGFWSSLNAANAYDAAGRFAVNCFFMISAALLLVPERSFDVVRQTRKIAVPLLFWSVVYVLADAVMVSRDVPAISGSVGDPNLFAPVQIVRDAISAPVAYHLWFVYVLVGIYLVVPLVRPITALEPARRRSLLLYAIGLWLVIDVLARFLPRLWDGAPTVYGPAVGPLVTGYLAVFLLGFLLFHHAPRVPSVALVAVIIASFAWIVVAVWRQQGTAEPDLWAYNNLNPPVLLLSSAVFLLVTRPSARTRPSPRWVGTFSALSYRVYLVHALVLHLFRQLGPTGELYSDQPVVGVPLVVALTLVVSVAVAWALERVRPMRSVW